MGGRLMPIDCGVCGGVIDWGDFGDDDSVPTCACVYEGPRTWRRRSPLGTAHSSVVPSDYFDSLVNALDEDAHSAVTEPEARGITRRVQRLIRRPLRTNDRNSTEEVLPVSSDIVPLLRERQSEIEQWWPDTDVPLTLVGVAADEIERLREVVAKQNGDMAHELLRNEQLRIDLNETQELLARCYKMAVGHGPNFDVFDTWEEAITAYEEREARRG